MNNNLIESLLNKIKHSNITWTSLDFLKRHLKTSSRSLRDVQIFRLYALYLQENKFLFDCTTTYFSISDNHLYILSKNLNTFDFRFDELDLIDTNAKWQQIDASINVLLRLKNAINLTNSDSDEECISVLSILEQIKK